MSHEYHQYGTMNKKQKYQTFIAFVSIAVIFLILFVLVIIIFPSSKGKIPHYYDNEGEIVKNSIVQKEYITIDTQSVGMVLLSKNIDNPVLLVCGGGPGIPEYLLESLYPSCLADLFTVCYFDYRGTGLSFSKNINAADMVTELFINDILTVTDYLKTRFSKEKIYLLGHSFGTYVAIKTVQQNPGNYYAYIAMSQICNQRESEYRAYNYMTEQYELSGNKKMVKEFSKYPIRQSDKIYKSYFTSSLRDNAMHDLGVGTTHNMRSVITGLFFPSLRCAAYTWKERINIWRGKLRSNNYSVVDELSQFNAFESVSALQIPIYFFAGQYDYTCCYSLQKEYYEKIEAPIKQFFDFENAAHSPVYEYPEEAKEYLQNILEKSR